jgi:hypothetical protein
VQGSPPGGPYWRLGMRLSRRPRAAKLVAGRMSREFRLSIDALPRPRGASPQLNQVRQWLTNNPFGGSPGRFTWRPKLFFSSESFTFPAKRISVQESQRRHGPGRPTRRRRLRSASASGNCASRAA